MRIRTWNAGALGLQPFMRRDKRRYEHGCSHDCCIGFRRRAVRWGCVCPSEPDRRVGRRCVTLLMTVGARRVPSGYAKWDLADRGCVCLCPIIGKRGGVISTHKMKHTHHTDIMCVFGRALRSCLASVVPGGAERTACAELKLCRTYKNLAHGADGTLAVLLFGQHKLASIDH